MHVLNEVDVDNDIKRLLTWLVVCIKTDNYQGLTDINIYSESFLVGVLNPVLGCDFKNLNTYTDKNYPGIDLGDESSRIAVQVTSTSDRDKVTHTIEEFEGRKDYDKYKKLYVVVLSDSKPNYHEFEINGKYEFDKNHVLSLNELCFVIKDLNEEQKHAIFAHLSKKMNIPGTTELNTTVEDFLVNKFFGALLEMANDDFDEMYPVESPDNCDLDLKKSRFEKYWSFVEERYREVLVLNQERQFSRAFDRLDLPERLKLQDFLRVQSDKALLKTDSPVEALDIVKADIIKRANIGLMSESQIENYLYYQLYICKLLPNPGEKAA